MEGALLGLKQLRSYVRSDVGQEMVELLIEREKRSWRRSSAKQKALSLQREDGF